MNSVPLAWVQEVRRQVQLHVRGLLATLALFFVSLGIGLYDLVTWPPSAPPGLDTVVYVRDMLLMQNEGVAAYLRTAPANLLYITVGVATHDAFGTSYFTFEYVAPTLLAAGLAPLVYLLGCQVTGSRGIGLAAGALEIVTYGRIAVQAEFAFTLVAILAFLAGLILLWHLQDHPARRSRGLVVVIALFTISGLGETYTFLFYTEMLLLGALLLEGLRRWERPRHPPGCAPGRPWWIAQIPLILASSWALVLLTYIPALVQTPISGWYGLFYWESSEPSWDLPKSGGANPPVTWGTFLTFGGSNGVGLEVTGFGILVVVGLLVLTLPRFNPALIVPGPGRSGLKGDRARFLAAWAGVAFIDAAALIGNPRFGAARPLYLVPSSLILVVGAWALVVLLRTLWAPAAPPDIPTPLSSPVPGGRETSPPEPRSPVEIHAD